MEKLKKIPALRFPGFGGEWEEKKLESVASKITDGTHDTPKPTREGVPYLTAIHIKDGFIDYANSYFLPKEEHEKIYKRCNPQKGDLLLVNIGAGTATCAMNIVDYEFSLKNVALIKPDIKLIAPSFLEQIQRKDSAKLFNQITSGGAQPFLSLKEIGNIKIVLPSVPEQTKIASFLSAIDEKLRALKKRKVLLQQYKQGVMQKIFAQEIRFKDDEGEDFPEWEEKKFGNVYSFKSTNSYSRENLNYEDGEIKNLHYGDIHTKFKVHFDITKEQVPFINRTIAIKTINDDAFCKNGDLIIADASEDYADIGKTVELFNLNNEKVVAGLHILLARPDLDKISIGFGGYLMGSANIKTQVMKVAQGTKVLSISATRLSNIDIQLPSLLEQSKIANFLSSIDKKITHCQKQIEQTEQYKKALLQQMFC